MRFWEIKRGCPFETASFNHYVMTLKLIASTAFG